MVQKQHRPGVRSRARCRGSLRRWFSAYVQIGLRRQFAQAGWLILCRHCGKWRRATL